MNVHEYMEPIFDLQFFAEGEAQQAAGGEPSNSGDAGAQGAQEAQPAQQEAARESEHTYTQADVDRIINQRFARFQREADRRVEQAREEARTEAERLAHRRELRAEAIDTLAQRGLPRALEQMLDYSGADACSASIDAVERVFRDAVQQGVEERLKQSGVQLQAAGKAPDYDSMSDADYYAARYKK